MCFTKDCACEGEQNLSQNTQASDIFKKTQLYTMNLETIVVRTTKWLYVTPFILLLAAAKRRLFVTDLRSFCRSTNVDKLPQHLRLKGFHFLSQRFQAAFHLLPIMADCI